MAFTPPLLTWLLSLVFPGFMMVINALALIVAIFFYPELTYRFRIGELRSKAFALFWNGVGSMVADDVPTPDLDNLFNQHCRGCVLDVGPGSGHQLHRFRGAFVTSKIKKIYGVEPSVDMHDGLRRKAIQVFGGKAPTLYTIVPSGAEPDKLLPALNQIQMLKYDNHEGRFDTIVCLRVLCGIPKQAETLQQFYSLLKPGGSIIFLEHVVNSARSAEGGSLIARILQSVYMLLGWSFFNGGCELTRDTAKTLQEAARVDGGWETVEINHRHSDGCVPEIWGYLQKKSTPKK